MDKFENKLRRTRSFNSQNNGPISINMKYRRRIFKILFTYLLTSIVCWTPLHLTIIYRHFRSTPIPSPWFFELAFFSQLSASLTAAMNPIIFGFLEQPFRKVVTKALKFKFLDKIVTSSPRDSNLQRNEVHAMNRRHNINYDFNKNNDAHGHHNNQPNDNNHHIHLTRNHRSTNAAEHSSGKNQHLSSNGTAKNPPGPGPTMSQTIAIRTSSFKQYASHQESSNGQHNKRVSFNTSANMKPVYVPQGVQGQSNKAYVNNEAPTDTTFARVHYPKCSSQSNHTVATMDLRSDMHQMNTNSLVDKPSYPLRPASVVSMDSINIEENLEELGEFEANKGEHIPGET